MFSFDPTIDLDVTEYEYELYEDALGAVKISSGKSGSSVFTIDVETNSSSVDDDQSTMTPVTYYGRIRPVDSSGNAGPWTPNSGLKESSATALIDGSHVMSLTAAKITAGTIKSHEIILSQQGISSNFVAPANMAILRSSNYDGKYYPATPNIVGSTPSWEEGTTGWIIAGDGHAEFSSASIRGTLKAGAIFINQYNRWKTDQFGNEMATPFFMVGNQASFARYDGINTFSVQGNITATSGTIAGWSILANELFASNFSGSMIIGGGIGPVPPAGGFVSGTGAMKIYAPTDAGKARQAIYSGYGTDYAYYENGIKQYALAVDPLKGIAYRQSENNWFSFKLVGSQIYITVSTDANPTGVDYPLCVSTDCDGAGPPNPVCTCNGIVLQGSGYCDGANPNCWTYYIYDSCGNVCGSYCDGPGCYF